MFEVWGRPDSSAVARVMWTLGELELVSRRHDWGGTYGGNDDPEYRKMQPAGRIPAVRLPSGESLWESATIVRYLASTHGEGRLVSADPVEKARSEAWMDWSSEFASAVNQLRRAYRRTDATEADIASAHRLAAPAFAVLDRALENRPFLMGDALSIADISLGVWGHRFHRCPGAARPRGFEAIDAWLARLRERPAYLDHVVAHVSSRPQSIGMEV